MDSVTIEEAQATRDDLIRRLKLGEEVVITEYNQPVAQLVASPLPRQVPRLGTLRGTALSMEGFDEPLEEFQE